MAYRFSRARSVAENVRAIAVQQVDKAIGEINDTSLDRHEVVHQVRKRCKKLRALIRLVRPAFDGYGRENTLFRDAARPLSYVRDAQSVIECFDRLMERFGDQVDRDALEPVRQALVERRDEIVEDDIALGHRLEAFLDAMHAARRRLESWQLESDGFDAIAEGLGRTYRRARKALRSAYCNPRPETFHEWRKRVKYHWYHNRLLRPIWSQVMRVRIGATDRLADLLGDDHDLAVFRQILLAEAGRFDCGSDVEAVIGLSDRYRLELQVQARPLGERLLTEKAKHFVRRYAGYWAVWHGREG